MSVAAVQRLSVKEYLALERASEVKHEFFDGFAMAGASEAHNLIVGNVAGELRSALKLRPCRVYPSDMRVLCPTGLRTYPDVSVVCGEPEFEDEQRDTLLNPLSIVEVTFGVYRSLRPGPQVPQLPDDRVDAGVRPRGAGPRAGRPLCPPAENRAMAAHDRGRFEGARRVHRDRVHAARR